MSKLTFQGAYIRHFDVRREEAGQFVRIHFSSQLTEPVQKQMSWGTPSAGEKEGKYDGELAGHQVTLTPRAKQLKSNAIELSVHAIEKFGFKVLDDGKVELKFNAVSNESGAAAKLEQYLAVCGRDPGFLAVMYDEQAKLGEQAAEEEETETAED